MRAVGLGRTARRICLSLLATLVAFGGLPAQAPGSSNQRIQVNVNLVTVRFTVKDEQGNFLNGLTLDRFKILENREPKEIAFFDPPANRGGRPGPLWLAFLLDVSGSTFATRSEEIFAAQAFFESVQTATQIGIFGFTDKLITFQDFTSARADAVKAFSQAREHLGQTALYDSLDQLVDKMASRTRAPSDRKIIIVISDAADKAYVKSAAVATKARTNNVSIYTILVPSAAQLYIGNPGEGAGEAVTGDTNTKQAQEEAFSQLSLKTNGKHFAGYETILDFDQTLALINDDVYGNLYSVGYYTDQPQLEKSERDIQVYVSYPGARPSALIQSVPERMSQKKRYIAALFDAAALSRLSESVPAHFEEIAAELDVLPSSREGGQLGLPFRVKISPFSLAVTKKGVRTQFGIIGLLLDRQGREVVRLREFFRGTLTPKEMEAGRSIVYNNKLMAPPGTYDLRLAVLDLSSWRVTAFNSVVQIGEE